MESPGNDNLDNSDKANQNSQSIFDLIQDADSKSYEAGVEAELHIILTLTDVIKRSTESSGAAATLLLFNNDGGSQYEHLSELVGCGKLSEAGQRNEVHVDECIGFKSLFSVAADAYIASNRLRIQVKKDDISKGNGYIVSKWMGKPTYEELFGIWKSSSESRLSSTVIVLPIKPEKIASVCNELKCVNPELILLLRRITRLQIRCDTESDRSFSFEEVTVRRLESSRVEHVDEEAVSCMAKLSVVEDLGRKVESRHYFVWEQDFKMSSCKEAEEKIAPAMTVKLAFPQRLPTEGGFQHEEYAPLVSGFPFILSCSHLSQLLCETFRLDCPKVCVQEIVSLTSHAYCRAIRVLLKKSYVEPASPTFVSPSHIYKYVPVEACQGVSEDLRKKILKDLNNQHCVLLAANIRSMMRKYFCKPSLSRRVCSSFRKILEKAYEEGEVSEIVNKASWFIVHGSVETNYPRMLDELQVPWMKSWEYVEVLEDAAWLARISDELYLQLVAFLSTLLNAPYVEDGISDTKVNSLRVVKCQDANGIKFVSVKDIRSRNMAMYMPPPWQSEFFRDWISKFNPWVRYRIIPLQTAHAMETAAAQHAGVKWLTEVATVCKIDVRGFASSLLERCSGSERPVWHYDECADFVLLVWNFVFASVQRGEMEQPQLLRWLAIIDENEHVLWVQSKRSILLLPRSCSKWSLIVKDVQSAWSEEDQTIVLSEKYLGWTSDSEACRGFLQVFFGATDLPDAALPKIPLQKLISFTSEQSRMFFQWLNRWVVFNSEKMDRFWQDLKTVAWLRTKSHGLQCPEVCYMFDSEVLTWDESAEYFVVDECFYGDLHPYTSTLRKLGVRMNTEENKEMLRSAQKRKVQIIHQRMLASKRAALFQEKS